MKVTFCIFYEDLNKAARHYLCKALKTTPEKEYENSSPLVVVKRELKEETKEKEL